MAFGKKYAVSYLDGIPVKISEKLRVPRKVTLPVNFHLNIPAELLTEEYKFDLENEVLANAEARRQAIEELTKARDEKVALDIEEFTKVSQSEESKSDCLHLQEDCSNEKKEDGGGTALTPLPPPPWTAAKILTPQPLEYKNMMENSSLILKKDLNLADFENETSPFDYMELQTINDLEELNTVFQGMACANPSIDGKRSSARIQGSNVSQNVAGDSNEHLPEQIEEMAVINEHSDKVSYFTPGSSVPNFNTFPKDEHPHPNNGYFIQKQLLFELTRPPVTESNDSTPRLRSAKSVSDIHSSLEGSSGVQQPSRSHTPPPSRTHLVSVSSKSTHPQNSPSQLPKNVAQEQTTIIPDPFSELSQEQQEFVSTLTDMGFARARVSRGVKQLGTDYKKVVDYLCLVQSLEDAGYDGWDTEMALHLHNYSIEEAKSFLDLLEQFQDLGFDKDLARKALVRHKNDRDKALDALLT